MLGKAKLLRVA